MCSKNKQKKGGHDMLDIEKLRNYIESHGIKKSFVAEKAKINRTSLSMILNGKQKCTADQYIAICKVIEKRPEDFVKEEGY